MALRNWLFLHFFDSVFFTFYITENSSFFRIHTPSVKSEFDCLCFRVLGRIFKFLWLFSFINEFCSRVYTYIQVKFLLGWKVKVTVENVYMYMQVFVYSNIPSRTYMLTKKFVFAPAIWGNLSYYGSNAIRNEILLYFIEFQSFEVCGGKDIYFKVKGFI